MTVTTLFIILGGMNIITADARTTSLPPQGFPAELCSRLETQPLEKPLLLWGSVFALQMGINRSQCWGVLNKTL